MEDEGGFGTHVEDEVEDAQVGEEAEFVVAHLVVFYGEDGEIGWGYCGGRDGRGATGGLGGVGDVVVEAEDCAYGCVGFAA